MNYLPEWFQDFVLNLNGDEIFWAPIILIFVGLLSVWALPALKGTGFTIFGWVAFLAMGGAAAAVWSHVWDWRADRYAEELREEIVGVELAGGTIEREDISADPYGIMTVSLNLNYDFGYSEVYAVEDVENFIDYIVVQYQNDETSESFLRNMRAFQELHVSIESEEEASIEDTLSYHRSTLLDYSDTVTLRGSSDDFFWMDEEVDEDAVEEVETFDEDGYRVVRSGLSPWYIADEQASEGGISVGQWNILNYAPDALEVINGISCSVFNGFSECDDEENEPQIYHSAALAFIAMIFVVVLAALIEVVLRKSLKRGKEEKEENPVSYYINRHRKGRKVEEHASKSGSDT